MKRVIVIDLDLNKCFKTKLRFDKKNGVYYVLYAKSTLDGILGFYQKVYVSNVDASIYVVKDRKAYTVNFNSESVTANAMTVDELREIIRTKVVYNLLTPSMATMVLYTLLGIGIGVGLGFMLYAYLPPEVIRSMFITNTTSTSTPSSITTTTIPLR